MAGSKRIIGSDKCLQSRRVLFEYWRGLKRIGAQWTSGDKVRNKRVGGGRNTALLKPGIHPAAYRKPMGWIGRKWSVGRFHYVHGSLTLCRASRSHFSRIQSWFYSGYSAPVSFRIGPFHIQHGQPAPTAFNRLLTVDKLLQKLLKSSDPPPSDIIKKKKSLLIIIKLLLLINIKLSLLIIIIKLLSLNYLLLNYYH